MPWLSPGVVYQASCYDKVMLALKIAVIAAEMSPYAKVGGLADVAYALPKHLKLLGHDVVAVIPYYKFMDLQNLAKELVGQQDVEFAGRTYHVKFLRTHLPAPQPVPVYFIYQEELFSGRNKVYGHSHDSLRFAFFDWCVFLLFEAIGWAPDVLHCHDAQTGLIPNYLRHVFAKKPFWQKTVTLFTIHNLLYQLVEGMWYQVPPEKRDRGHNTPPDDPAKLRTMNFTLRAIRNADLINTVSERYAQEILTKKFGEGLDGYLLRRRDRVFGIINGIDYSVFNPSLDHHLSIHYDWNSLDKKLVNKNALQNSLGLPSNRDVPLIGMAHRLTEQKGFDLILHILPALLRQPVQLVIVGGGDREYLRQFRQVAKRHPDQVAVHLEFSEPMASRIYAGSDMFLMPSRFEPCGISQLISLRYGSVPIVHKTGGLADTIVDFNPRTGVGTGFVFQTYDPDDFLVALVRAIETYKYPRVWEHLTWQAMRKSFSWELPTRKYVELYQRAIRLRHAVG